MLVVSKARPIRHHRGLILPKLSDPALQVGSDFFLAFSPNASNPGNAVHTTRNTPKVIGASRAGARSGAVELNQHASTRSSPVSSAMTAEMVKLLANTFRAINIGLVNELAIICDGSASTCGRLSTRQDDTLPNSCVLSRPGTRRPTASDRPPVSVVEIAHDQLHGPVHRTGNDHQSSIGTRRNEGDDALNAARKSVKGEQDF